MPTKLDARVDKHDREIAAIRKLILEGMKLVVEHRKGMRELRVAQKKTEETLERFIRSFERNGPTNGHSKKSKIQ